MLTRRQSLFEAAQGLAGVGIAQLGFTSRAKGADASRGRSL
jgi:hypothetical protein